MKKFKRKTVFQRQLRKAEFAGIIMPCSGVCPFCGNSPVFMINLYDARACLYCNTWLEKACSNPNCPYCANRPESPAGAFFILKDKIRRNEQLFRKDWLRKNYQHKHNGKLRHQKRILQNKGG